jgi:hypothetical protein
MTPPSPPGSYKDINNEKLRMLVEEQGSYSGLDDETPPKVEGDSLQQIDKRYCYQ